MFQFIPSKKYLFLLLFIIPFSFTKKFHDIWEKYVIDTLLIHFEKNIWNDIIVIVLMAIMIYQLYKKIIVNRYIFSRFQQISTILTFIVYAIYRLEWIKHPFTFTTLSLYTGFVYWDLIIFIPFIAFIFFTGEKFFIVDLYYIVFPKSKKRNGFILDIPDKPENETNVSEIITELVKKLLNTESKGNAFAVGIVGEWGTGKTTLLNQIKDVLEKEQNKQQENIIIDFNPWNSTNSQNIITDFFEHFREELSKYSAEIDDSLQNYTQKLASIEGDDWLSKGIKIMTSLFGNNKTMIQEYEQINTILQQINRQIFVFIDDLDRLDKKEIIEVIRLIRNSANFHNTFFIVAYEKSYVEQAIEELNPENKSFFLEKIFQLELHLPKYEYEIIAEDLYNRLIVQIPFLKEHTELKEFILTHQFLSKIIQNFRDVKRFVNTFSLVYTEKLAKEVFFPDFFHIELLRFKYPLVYDLIKKKEYDVLKIIKESTYLKVNTDEKIKTTLKEKLNTKYLYPKYIDDIIFIVEFMFNAIYSDSHFINLYNILFKDNNNYIKNESWFNSYFKYDIYGNMIGNFEFNQARKNITSFKVAIDKWYRNNLGLIFMKYCSYIKDFESDDEQEIFIEGIFYAQYLEIINFDMYNQFIIDLFSFKDNNRLKIFTQNLFNNAKFPYNFESKFLYELNSIPNDNFILSKEERINYLIQYLKRTAEQLNKYDDKLRISFFHTITNSNINNQGAKYPQQAKDIVISFLKEKDLIGFLERYINVVNHFDEKKYYSMNFNFDYIFNNNKDFESFFKECYNNTEDMKIKKSIDEFLPFYNLSRENNFNPNGIPFKEFTYLKIKEP